MENYLYLLEVFVETITFSSNLSEIPKPNDVIISGEIGKFVKVDIFTMHHDADAKDTNSPQMNINCGKSSLFSCAPNELLKKIKEYPLRIVVSIKRRVVAETSIKWNKSFFDLITKATETFGVSGPVSTQDKFILNEPKTGTIMGDIKLTIKLSSFGTNIQTSYQLIDSLKDSKKKYLIRGARGETTFECQKFGTGSSSELLPVSPLFTPAKTDAEPTSISKSKFNDDPVSWMALFKSNLDPKSSNVPDEFNIAISNMFNKPPLTNPSNITFDIVSIVERPEENKFMDLRIRGGSRGLIFEVDPSMQITRKSVSTQDIKDAEILTTDKIEKLLCKSKDCPAAKKFKEFGIGPLATVKGLGTLRYDVSPPVTYGISQTYGVFDEYGPYGLFSRPKRPEDPFVPPNKNNDWAESCWKPKPKKKEQKSTERGCCKEHHPPLRLTGGGVLDYEDVKSPLHECKAIMDQFDQILAQYKEAIGPCGKPTCPYAPNLSKEICKKRCKQPGDRVKTEETKQYVLKASETPKDGAPKTNQLQGACGSAKCPYAKYKTGLVDEDAMMELQYLPSAPSGKCGHPKCPFPVQPELPPIHWDCPDPLPKGRCKNPDCPFLPKDIKCLNAVLKKGPCENFNCPYSVPDPCGSPTCPFSNKECPYKQQTDSNSLCSNPECPFANNDDDSLCENPDCPFSKEKPQGNDVGNSPNCPLTKTTCPQPAPCYVPPCGNICPSSIPFCPPLINPYFQALLTAYLQAVAPCNQELFKICFGGPDCPLTKNKQSRIEKQRSETQRAHDKDVCSQKKKTGQSTGEPERSCNNPTCPFIPKRPPPPDDTCANPHCPFAKPSDKKTSKKGDEGNELKEGATEYVVETRTEVDNRPCMKGTCKSQGGDLVCEECGNCGTCPCSGEEETDQLAKTSFRKPSPSDEVCANPNCPCAKPSDKKTNRKGDEGKELKEGATEYVVETRTEVDNRPCTKGTCKSQGGDLVCDECGKDGTCPCDEEEEKVDKRDKTYFKKPSPCYIPAQNDVRARETCFTKPQPPPCNVSANVCGIPWTCPYMINLLQALLAYCLPFTVCSDVNCPYTAKEVNDMMQAIFGKAFGQDQGVRSKQSKDENEPKEGDVEYTSETRIDVDNRPCTAKTCKAQGGELVCTECPCGQGDAPEPAEGATEYEREDALICDVCSCGIHGQGKQLVKTSQKGRSGFKGARSKRRKGKFVYSLGDKYPGIQIGHRECVLPTLNVPRTMGWLWNVYTPCLGLKPRRGWRPGAVAKIIAERIRQHREAQGIKMLQIKDVAYGKKGDGYESATSMHIPPKPTLQIKKKDGCYWITMNPLKDPHTLVENENPYMDCTPMQFKIVKNKNKKEEIENEYRTCFCSDDEHIIAESSSSDSELDIEFTPPAGVIHPERFKKKRNVVHEGTQCLDADFETKSEKSSKTDKEKDEKGKGKGKKGKEKKGKEKKGKEKKEKEKKGNEKKGKGKTEKKK